MPCFDPRRILFKYVSCCSIVVGDVLTAWRPRYLCPRHWTLKKRERIRRRVEGHTDVQRRSCITGKIICHSKGLSMVKCLREITKELTVCSRCQGLIQTQVVL